MDLVALASLRRGRLRCHLEREPRDSLDAVACKNARLLGHLVRRADVQASAEPGVLPFGVFPHADHVDICRRPARERRGDTGQKTHRPQIDVLLEALAQRQDQLPDRDVIGHARVANRAEKDRLELLELIEPVRIHHPALAAVELAAPRELLHLQDLRRRALDDLECRGNDLLTDTVTRNDCDFVHRRILLGGSAGVGARRSGCQFGRSWFPPF